MSERLDAEVVGFTFQSDEGGFAVVRMRTAEGVRFVAVGALAHLAPGQRVVMTGGWIDDLRFGRQFKVESCLTEDPRTTDGMEKYLAAILTGVGPELAQRIVARFGLDALRIAREEPDRLLEVPGISQKKLERIAISREQADAAARLEVMLRGYGLTPKLCARVAERFGEDAAAIVSRSPYRLTEVRGVGFRTADLIARSNGVAADDPGRIDAAAQFLLEEGEDEGHCYLPEGVLLTRMEKLDIPTEPARAALDRLSGLGRVVRHSALAEENRALFRPWMERMEGRVARGLRDRAGHTGGVIVDVKAAEARVGLELNADQRDALFRAMNHRVCVITGGPGTGKTTLVKVLLQVARQAQQSWLLCAPTGRAARRLTESCGQPARTMHRMLEFSMRDFRFQRNYERPLEADGVLVDEASMVDLPLMDSLLQALPARTRLVLVGDVDQLPSVGPGQVLRDVIRSGAVPVARLNEVYRQAQDSAIVTNAHRVNHGELPISSEQEEGRKRDFFLLFRDDAEDARRTLLKVIQERLPPQGFDPRTDVQVLTPMHNGPLGTIALNEAMQGLLNPTGESLRVGERLYRVGDRVIQTKNDYDNDVFNGDIGLVQEVAGPSLTIDFDGRVVTLSGDALDALDLAYAISIHKSQGSEYPAVMVVMHNAHHVMLRRTLLYTALTRARRFTCLVTTPRALKTAISRAGGEERYTQLAERLLELAQRG